MRPWILQLGPLLVSSDARQELAMTAHNLTTDDYRNIIWAERDLPIKRKRPRSRSWPSSCYDKALKGYVLAQVPASNVRQLQRRKP